MNERINNNINRSVEREARRRRLPGLIMTGLLLLAVALFLWRLWTLKLLPTLLFAALAFVLLLFVLLVCVLSRDAGRRGRFVFALLLTLLIGAVSGAGFYAGTRFSDTIRAMFRPDSTETVIMQVYVRADDPAQSLSDLKDETLGILTRIDRRATDEMLEKLAKELGPAPTIAEYDSPVQLLHALAEGQVRAILINEHYLTLLEEGSEAANVRSLHAQAVVIAVTTAAPPETKDQDPTLPPDDPARPSGQDPEESGAQPAEPGYSDDERLTAKGSCFIVYISGIDSREGLVSRSRSDVNILAAVNPDTRQVVLISTPRDCAVLTSVSGDQPDTLTYTGNYGIDVSCDALERLYNLHIDYWFRVDFSGFVRIIDVLGGIDINSDKSFSTDGGYYFRQGVNHVDGAAALSFARERHAFGGSDALRGPHQMEVIRATLKKAASSQILSSWDQLLSAVSDCFEMTVPYDIIASVVRRQLTQSGEWNIVSCALDGSYDIRSIFSLYSPNYMFLPEDASIRTARLLIWRLLEGREVSAP